MKRLRATIVAALLAGLLAGCGSPTIGDEAPAAPSAPAVTRDATLVIGSIGDDAVAEAGAFQPFADAPAKRLAGAGIRDGRVVVASSIGEMRTFLRKGQVDLFMDSPYPALTVAEGAGGVPMLTRWKEGLASYRSVVFVKADSQIRSLPDLRGARIGFDDDFSTSGYFLPRAELAGAGLALGELAAPDRPIPAGELGYVFTGDDENTLFWVDEGKVEAGAMSESELRELAGARFRDLRILATLPTVPRQIVIRGQGLAPRVVAPLERVLTTMHRDAAGRQAMAAFEDTTRFERLDAATARRLRSLLERMRARAEAQ